MSHQNSRENFFILLVWGNWFVRFTCCWCSPPGPPTCCWCSPPGSVSPLVWEPTGSVEERNSPWPTPGTWGGWEPWSRPGWRPWSGLCGSTSNLIDRESRIVQQGSARTTFNSIHSWNCFESYLITYNLTHIILLFSFQFGGLVWILLNTWQILVLHNPCREY